MNQEVSTLRGLLVDWDEVANTDLDDMVASEVICPQRCFIDVRVSGGTRKRHWENY